MVVGSGRLRDALSPVIPARMAAERIILITDRRLGSVEQSLEAPPGAACAERLTISP